MNPKQSSERALMRLVLLAAILIVPGSVKLWHSVGTGPFGLDGAFYVNVARNVQEGAGLVTNVSLYHEGHLELPARTRLIYPLWPAVLGHTARLIGLFPAIAVLPKLLFFVNLLLFYRLGNLLAVRMNRADLTESIFTPGHLLVILLAANSYFFAVTVQPYTDALGLALVFATLLLLDRAVTTDHEGKARLVAGASGLIAGLALLTRTQSMILLVAAAAALLWAVFCDRRMFGRVAAFAVVSGVLVATWYFGFHTIEHTRAAIGYDRMWAEPGTSGEWLRQRFAGLVTSLNPFSRFSYFHSLGAAIVLPLLAAPLAFREWLRRRRLCASAESVLPAVTILAGLGFFFVLNLFHHRPGFFLPWLFGYRHALPVVLLIAPAIVYLMGRARPLRIATLVIVAVSALAGFASIVRIATHPEVAAPTAAEQLLARWVAEQPRRPVLLTTHAQQLGVYTRANLHWTLCDTAPEQTRDMLEKLPIDHVVLYAGERRCDFVRGLGDLLVQEARFGGESDGIYLLGRRQR